MQKREYALAGVDYSKLEPFKRRMVEMGQRTLSFPNKRGVFIDPAVFNAHGAGYEYQGPHRSHKWIVVIEGLGNKNWIAEWMYRFAGNGKTYYDGIGIDTAMMAVGDLIAQGAMPVVYVDEVAAGDSEWFADDKRSSDLAAGFYSACAEVGMALPAGESPALRYLVRSEPPVVSAPVLSGSAVGIIAPSSRQVTGVDLCAGDRIVGATASGLHANGISLVIRRALQLPDQFLTELPNGRTLGTEVLIPTRSYVGLVETLLEHEVEIHALLPGTGSGLSKIAYDRRPFTYRIHSWVEVPLLFQFMRELGVSLYDCLTTFNWGIGYYIFVPPHEVNRACKLGELAGYVLAEVGIVEEGERKVIFEPAENTELPPPGE